MQSTGSSTLDIVILGWVLLCRDIFAFCLNNVCFVYYITVRIFSLRIFNREFEEVFFSLIYLRFFMNVIKLFCVMMMHKVYEYTRQEWKQ